MPLIVVQGSMRRDGTLSDAVLSQDDSGELQYIIMNGFDVPITIIDVGLVDEPRHNMKVSTDGIPPHQLLQPGQSVTAFVHIGTSACALQRYSFKVKVEYMFTPPSPQYGQLQFEVVKAR
jgi:hypothetical protein